MMLQLHSVCSFSSQNPRLGCCNRSISSHEFLGCSLPRRSRASHVRVTQSSNWKLSSLQCRQTEYYDQEQRFSALGNSSYSSSGAVGALPPRVFVGHSIYKGKAALTVEPRAPEFTSLESGAFKLSREGCVLLQFAPAEAVRTYDWSRKQVFSLSVTEIATLIGLGPRDSCEFFHDPFKGKSDEGNIRKVLKVEPIRDGSGHFFNLSVQNKMVNLDENISIPVTKAELTVLVSAFNFILPYLVGWHAYAETIRVDSGQRANDTTTRYGGDFEWSRCTICFYTLRSRESRFLESVWAYKYTSSLLFFVCVLPFIAFAPNKRRLESRSLLVRAPFSRTVASSG